MVTQRISDTKKRPWLNNAISLVKDLEWFIQVVNTRMDLYFGRETDIRDIYELRPPALDEKDNSIYANFLRHYGVSFEERIILLLALIPHIAPHILDVFLTKNNTTEQGFTEFGGLKGNTHAGFLPTRETMLFILAGNRLEKRFELSKLFCDSHFFKAHNILNIGDVNHGEPENSGMLLLTDEYIDYFTIGESRKPTFGMDFPAKLVTTQLDWDDLVVDLHTLQQLLEIKSWLNHGETLMKEWKMKRRLKPGYKVLFYGPPGTGKTLTACLFGKFSGKDVYRIDLSMVVSKYIGETAKNLEKVFRKAENKNWILFFDEADALFGKRTQISDAHDKYANQEISYLLQRLEDYPGLVILASNMKSNIDEAFTRRLQTMIAFPMPGTRERLRLWRESFSSLCKLDNSLDLEQIAKKYVLSGGSILNAVMYSSLMALQRGENTILEKDILEGIRKEYEKNGKTM